MFFARVFLLTLPALAGGAARAAVTEVRQGNGFAVTPGAGRPR